MGSASTHLECCTWREGHGIGPTDAFCREALPEVFYDCTEGDVRHDPLFEQLRLKLMKGQMLADYAYGEISENACAVRPHDGPPKRSPSSEEFISKPGKWLGKTFQRLNVKDSLHSGEVKGPSWYPGMGADLEVRCKGYMKTRRKQQATLSLQYGSMYECVACDAIRASGKVEDILERLVPLNSVPGLPSGIKEGERGAGQELHWTTDCPLPRVLCVNLKLPYTTGSNDAGCSFVAFFHIKPQVLQELQSGNPSPCIRMFQDFCAGPAGTPGIRDDPHRSLALRRNKTKTSDAAADSGLLKATAWCENTEDLSIPRWMARFNGKPTTITKSGYIVKQSQEAGSPGEWMEVGVDVRDFNWLARRGLVSYKGRLPQANLHFGFMIQAVEDADMPEGLICDMHVQGVDIENDPVQITI
mmetsp:Transcript_156318/g.284326  ORF Transcript_156318/g.284326 Transcript_156318/m.284326 type:complete len:415 (-) Transcript_156318:94-1338(-)